MSCENNLLLLLFIYFYLVYLRILKRKDFAQIYIFFSVNNLLIIWNKVCNLSTSNGLLYCLHYCLAKETANIVVHEIRLSTDNNGTLLSMINSQAL